MAEDVSLSYEEGWDLDITGDSDPIDPDLGVSTPAAPSRAQGVVMKAAVIPAHRLRPSGSVVMVASLVTREGAPDA